MVEDLNGLHHVGVVVRDLPTAIDTYRRLGFTVAPPAYPTLPSAPGKPPRPVGAANTHIYLRRNFIEMVTVVDENRPIAAAAKLIPIEVPDDKLPGLLAAVRGAAATLTARLDRFQGMHILIFDTPDIDRAATRLDTEGVGHGGVHAIQRPIETAAGIRMVPARYLEISGEEPGMPPEGRIGVAQNDGVEAPQRPEHANGAIDLIGCTLGVPDDALPGVARRYERYLGRPADRDARTATFDLGGAAVTLVAASALPDILPGERLPALPAFVACTVAVHDIARTEHHLRAAAVPHVKLRAGEVLVPAEQALGAAVVFRLTAG